jgi:phosphate/sulfate permease
MMTLPRKSPVLFTLVVAWLLTSSLAAFSSHTSSRLAFTGRLNQSSRSIDAPTQVTERPSWMDLPKSVQKDSRFVEQSLPTAEIIVGRVAMVGAMGLLVGELTTGESVIEQFQDLVQMVVQ